MPCDLLQAGSKPSPPASRTSRQDTSHHKRASKLHVKFPSIAQEVSVCVCVCWGGGRERDMRVFGFRDEEEHPGMRFGAWTSPFCHSDVISCSIRRVFSMYNRVSMHHVSCIMYNAGCLWPWLPLLRTSPPGSCLHARTHRIATHHHISHT